MKPKSSKLIWIIGAVVVIGILIYIFASKGSTAPAPSTNASLVTTSGTGATTTGVIPTTATTSGNTGDQVVAILQNLSTITLSNAIFQNPSFAMLTDLSIQIPPATNQGRRNPFAAVGTDAVVAAPVTPTPLAKTPSGSVTPKPQTNTGGPAGF